MWFSARGRSLLFAVLLAVAGGTAWGGDPSAARSAGAPMPDDTKQSGANRDGVPVAVDDCPLAIGPVQGDADRDGRADSCDCAPLDARAWARPGEVGGFRIGGDKATIAWDVPANPGGSLDALRYDVLRATDPADFVTGTSCVATGLGPYPVTADLSRPAAGHAYYYLARARNACPSAFGPLAFGPAGLEIASRLCP
jgi:hypothetical protein